MYSCHLLISSASVRSILFLSFIVPIGSAGKESACNVGDLGSIPGLGRSPGEGKGYVVQYSGLENSMDYIVHGVTKSQTRLNSFHFSLCMKCILGILIFLKRSLVFPILLFSSISLHWSLKKAYFLLLAIVWNSAFRCVYLSFSPLPFSSLRFSAICKASSDNHFAFLFLEDGFDQCLLYNGHSSSGTLSVTYADGQLYQLLWIFTYKFLFEFLFSMFLSI